MTRGVVPVGVYNVVASFNARISSFIHCSASGRLEAGPHLTHVFPWAGGPVYSYRLAKAVRELINRQMSTS